MICMVGGEGGGEGERVIGYEMTGLEVVGGDDGLVVGKVTAGTLVFTGELLLEDEKGSNEVKFNFEKRELLPDCMWLSLLPLSLLYATSFWRVEAK